MAEKNAYELGLENVPRALKGRYEDVFENKRTRLVPLIIFFYLCKIRFALDGDYSQEGDFFVWKVRRSSDTIPFTVVLSLQDTNFLLRFYEGKIESVTMLSFEPPLFKINATEDSLVCFVEFPTNKTMVLNSAEGMGYFQLVIEMGLLLIEIEKQNQVPIQA
jgi:hypothetical protein